LLWEAAVQTKGWHQWLWMTRLRHAKAEIVLASGRYEDAAEAAREAVAEAERWGRRKYVQASQSLLGRALHSLGRPDDAVAELRVALERAEKLSQPASIWSTASALALALADAGDDAGADETAALARRTLDAFVAGLSETRRERFLASPYLEATIAIAR
jgi:tetratricopeptide (TPR) repeat protein